MTNYLKKIDSYYVLQILILLLCLSPIILSIFLATNGTAVAIKIGDHYTGINFPCVFKEFTGFKCPVCGMTRSFIYTSRLEFANSLSKNKAGLLLFVFCFLQIPYRILLIIRPNSQIQKYFKFIEIGLLLLIGIIITLQFILQFIN
jgi:hypothetical protein